MRRFWLVALAASGCGNILGLPEGQLVGPADARPPVVPDADMTPDAPPPPPPLKITVESPGTGGGRVRSTPAGIDCPGTCAGDFAPATRVTLTAVADGGSRFVGWRGTACTGGGSCVIMLAEDTTVGADFADNSDGHNFVFVTDETYAPADLTPLTAADAKCNESAKAGRMPGTYVAWLSTTTEPARDRLGTARGWVRPDGQPFADTVTDIRNGRIYYPPHITARNTTFDDLGVATGTNDVGTVVRNCSDFMSTTGVMTIGESMSTARSWTFWGSSDFGGMCNNKFHIYCFGVERSKALDPPPRQTGRLAFLSAGRFSAGNGIGPADMICATEAMMAGKSGTFKAAIATSTASAGSRFDPSGPQWVRVDGIPLGPAGTFPLDELSAPLNQMLNGDYVEAAVAVGAYTSMQKPPTALDCNDWTSTVMTAQFMPWNAASIRRSYSNFQGTFNCPGNQQVYCFEQ